MANLQTHPIKGAGHWKHQRITAILLIPLSIWFLIDLLRHTQADYPVVLAWAAQPWIGTALALFMGLMFYHGALGLQVVIEDYVPHLLWQTVLVVKVKIFSFIMAVLSWFFIIRIAINANG